MLTSDTFETLDRYSETAQQNLDRPFTVSGRRGYLVGHMNGAFPDLGHHIPGELAGLVRFEIRGAWWSDWPDRPDEAHYNSANGSIVAHDSLTTSWGAFMQGDTKPVNSEIGPDMWGPEKTVSLKGSDHRPEGIL